MSRLMSFVVLIGVITVVGFLFYRVMASFLLPLFAAAVLVVIFHPIYRWMLAKTRRKQLAAALTCGTIVLIVVLPLALLVAFAASEGAAALHWDQKAVIAKKDALLVRYGLDIPWGRDLCDQLIVMTTEIDDLSAAGDGEEDEEERDRPVDRLLRDVEQNRLAADLAELRQQVEQTNALLLQRAQEVDRRLREQEQGLQANSEQTKADERYLNDLLVRQQKLQQLQQQWTAFDTTVRDIPASSAEVVALPTATISDIQYASVEKARSAFDAFKLDYVGSPLMIWVRDMANPTDSRIKAWMRSGKVALQKWLLAIGGATPQVAANTIIGLLVTIVAVYFFLADGNAMVRSMMKLSPLDDVYEKELLVEFDQISRAVVVATLLSAAVQAVLAGIGFYVAGIESVFLLTLLTGFLAMIPFVGATAVWLPTAMWLYFFEDRTGAAIGLGLYGMIIVSQADNLIKPWVLHGQSRLHPLLALLSVLGGVQALGPVGIIVGPMIVAFAQALMNILHRELTDLENSDKRGGRADGRRARGVVVIPVEGFSSIALTGQSLRR